MGANEGGEVERQDVGVDDFDVGCARREGEVCGAFAKRSGESGVSLDGDDATGARREKLRHFAVARADFEPCRIGRGGKRFGDARPPGNLREKILAELLACHNALECSNFRHGRPIWRRNPSAFTGFTLNSYYETGTRLLDFLFRDNSVAVSRHFGTNPNWDKRQSRHRQTIRTDLSYDSAYRTYLWRGAPKSRYPARREYRISNGDQRASPVERGCSK